MTVKSMCQSLPLVITISIHPWDIMIYWLSWKSEKEENNLANEYIRTKTLKLKGIRGMYNLENRKDKLFAYVFAYLSHDFWPWLQVIIQKTTYSMIWLQVYRED